MSTPVVRNGSTSDHRWLVAAARATLGSEYQAHSQRQFDVRHGNLLIAVRGRRRVGFLTWDHAADVSEILAIACTKQRIGVGTALIEAVEAAARCVGSARLLVVTTDTNVIAQRFYERCGFRLVDRRIGAVDECRRLYKPEIPTEMHDEYVFERRIDGSS
jgi:ribosomal protein S18 acetylase RimI-like enzyme